MSRYYFLASLMLLSVNTLAQDALIKKAKQVHEKTLTIDTHTDVPMLMVRPGFDINAQHSLADGRSTVDFPRMKQGGMDAMFFVVYLGQGPLTPEAHAQVKAKALGIFETVHRAVKHNPTVAELALKADDAARIEKTGKRGIFIGLENGYPIGEDIGMVKQFYELGCRYITLCHSTNNLICDSSTDPKGAVFHGLSPLGEQVVAEMNRLGIVVDVSHVSDETVEDVLVLSKTPIVASHSNARNLCDVPRNLPDALIKKIAAKGGVVQVNFVSDFLKKISPEHQKELAEVRARFMKAVDAERDKIMSEMQAIQQKYAQDKATVADIVRHIDYIKNLVGIDHVGIGSDFDGGGGVAGCEDVSQMGNITLELLKKGYSTKDIAQIWGGNFLRVMRAVEKAKL